MNKYFYEVFENIPRQGPGLNESTKRAFSCIKQQLTEKPEILDIGCGKGVQTLELARYTFGNITAVDNHQFFLDCLEENFKRQVLTNIRVKNADMTSLPFKKSSFDLLWAEGSVFIMGMKEGLKQWRQFIKAKGFLVFTDLVWLGSERPKELTEYWEAECLYILSIEEALEEVNRAGYQLIDHFTLPNEGWTEQYLLPQQTIIGNLRAKHTNIQEAMEVFNEIEFEREIFEKYNAYFGYEFFILKKA